MFAIDTPLPSDSPPEPNAWALNPPPPPPTMLVPGATEGGSIPGPVSLPTPPPGASLADLASFSFAWADAQRAAAYQADLSAGTALVVTDQDAVAAKAAAAVNAALSAFGLPGLTADAFKLPAPGSLDSFLLPGSSVTHGDAGANLFQGSANGRQAIDGGAGIDTLTYDFASTAIRVTETFTGVWSVAKPAGTDTLAGVEVLRFTDGSLDLTTHQFTPNAAPDAAALAAAEPQATARGLPAQAQAQAWQDADGGVFVTGQGGHAVGLGAAGAGWHLAARADLDGDGKADLVFRNDAGDLHMWKMDGSIVASQTGIGTAGSGWQLLGAADLTRDGKADLVFENAHGEVYAWRMDGATPVEGQALGVVGAGWSFLRAVDANADGNTDLLWHNADGHVWEWQMDGMSIAAGVAASSAWIGA